MKKNWGSKVFDVCNTVFLILLCLIMIYPLYYILIYSLNEGSDSLKGGLYFLPRVFTTFNYQYVLSNGVIRSAYLITIARTLLGTVTGLAVTGLTAYGISFRRIPGRKFLMTLIIIPMLFSGGLIPYYIQLTQLKLTNTFWVYVIPSMFNIWNMFVLMRGFMGIPESLRESALIDGASEPVIFLKIALPLSKASLAAIGLFTAVYHWNDWYSGAYYVNTTKLIPLQTYLQRLFSADSMSALSGNSGNAAMLGEAAFRQSQMSTMTITSLKMAAVMVGTLPILCIYPFLQKYFVKGVMVGSVKE